MVSGEDRPSKKVNLHNTIKRAARILKGMYAEAMEDAKVVEMENFMEEYNFRVPEILAEAQYSHQEIDGQNPSTSGPSRRSRRHKVERLCDVSAEEVDRRNVPEFTELQPSAVFGGEPADAVQRATW